MTCNNCMLMTLPAEVYEQSYIQGKNLETGCNTLASTRVTKSEVKTQKKSKLNVNKIYDLFPKRKNH